MRPLAFQGILATNCYEQLKALLERHSAFLAAHGMPNAAVFLAEPVHDERSGRIDWYGEGTGKACKLSSLTGIEQQGVHTKLEKCSTALQCLIKARSRQPSESSGILIDPGLALLKLALQHPSATEDLYVLDGRPILINWGFHPGAEGATPEDIMRLGAPTQGPVHMQEAASKNFSLPPSKFLPGEKSATYKQAPRGPKYAYWLLPLLLFLLLLWLLLAALGLCPSPLPVACFRQEFPALKTEVLRQEALGEEYAHLLDNLQGRAALCQPAHNEEPTSELKPVLPLDPTPVEEKKPQVKAPQKEPTNKESTEDTPFFGEAPNVATPPIQKEPVRRKEQSPQEHNIEKKELPHPPVASKEPEKPVQRPQPRKNEDMKIPKDAAQKKDLSFLEGCWRSETGLFNNHGVPITGEYCFDKHGRGRRFIHEEGGRTCSGTASAQFNGNQLAIDAAPAACSGGTTYVPQAVACSGSENSTQCRGHELGGNRNNWDARFKRK